jgi:hypothetical protein
MGCPFDMDDLMSTIDECYGYVMQDINATIWEELVKA